MTAHCHKVVRDVAKEAAGHLYEVVMGNDAVFKEWKRQNPDCNAKELERRFIERNWGKCLQFARTTLALSLRDPRVPDGRKEEILDILEKDQMLVRGRGKVLAAVPATVN